MLQTQKRLFSSVSSRIIKSTPPNVYLKINQELESPTIRVPATATPDHRLAIENARAALMEKKNKKLDTVKVDSDNVDERKSTELEEEQVQQDEVVKESGFMSRLMKDGGEKMLKVHKTYIHIDYTRFIEPCGQIKGLSLDDALLQLEWGKKVISLKVKEALKDAIIKAKENGFNLSKTYIAEAYIKESSHGLSQRFTSKYLRGRGRYGATPHPKTARLEIILQERSKGFASKELADPLEWLRVRLRNKKKEIIRIETAEEIAESNKFQIKQIFQ